MRQLARTLSYLKRYWLWAIGTFFGLLIASGTRLAIPRLTQVIIDEGITLGREGVIIGASFGIVGLAIAGSVFTFLQGMLAARTAQGVAYDLRNELYKKIQSLSFSYHDRAQTGQLLTRATSDVEMVHRFVGMGIIHFVSAILMMVGSVVLLIVTDWQLALILLVLMPLTFGVFGFFELEFGQVIVHVSDFYVKVSERSVIGDDKVDFVQRIVLVLKLHVGPDSRRNAVSRRVTVRLQHEAFAEDRVAPDVVRYDVGLGAGVYLERAGAGRREKRGDDQTGAQRSWW